MTHDHATWHLSIVNVLIEQVGEFFHSVARDFGRLILQLCEYLEKYHEEGLIGSGIVIRETCQVFTYQLLKFARLLRNLNLHIFQPEDLMRRLNQALKKHILSYIKKQGTPPKKLDCPASCKALTLQSLECLEDNPEQDSRTLW